jgi:hypothetical protein
MSSSIGSMPHSASQSSLGGRASAELPDTSDISPGTIEETDAARASLSAVVSMVNTEKCGLPLALFTKVKIPISSFCKYLNLFLKRN